MDFLSISASPFSTQRPPPRSSLLTTTPKHHSPLPFLLLSSRKPSPETVAPPLPPPEKAPVPTISRRPINPITGGTGAATGKPSVAAVNPLSSKLWLSAKLSPPPPLPPPKQEQVEIIENAKPDEEAEVVAKPNPELRDKAKIFVGNLPFWVKKDEICRFFRQFGPLKKVELIKGHESPQRNVGYLPSVSC